jgi:hypothetical protein
LKKPRYTGVSALSSSAHFPPPTCLANSSSCYLGLQRVASMGLNKLTAAWGFDMVHFECHRFLAGSSLQAMRPLYKDANRSRLLCVKSPLIQAVVPMYENGTTVVAWEYRPEALQSMQEHREQVLKSSPACLALMSLPDMRISSSVLVHSVATVLYDQATNLLITVGFSSMQSIVVNAYDPLTLKSLWRCRLPLEVAWMLRAPRVSDGFLLFVGAQEPFLGTVFTIDLKQKQVYEQDPPTTGNGRRRPRRRRLPRGMVLQSAPDDDIEPGLHARCPAVAMPDKRNLLKGSSVASGSSAKAWFRDEHR